MKAFDRLQSRLFRDDAKDAAGEAKDGERRLNHRRPIESPVVAKVGPAHYECRLIDIGPGGAFLTPSFAAGLGSDIVVSVPNTRISAAASVTRIGPDGVGVQFSEEGTGALVAAWCRGLFSSNSPDRRSEVRPQGSIQI